MLWLITAKPWISNQAGTGTNQNYLKTKIKEQSSKNKGMHFDVALSDGAMQTPHKSQNVLKPI
jgi:hypothetical protein